MLTVALDEDHYTERSTIFGRYDLMEATVEDLYKYTCMHLVVNVIFWHRLIISLSVGIHFHCVETRPIDISDMPDLHSGFYLSLNSPLSAVRLPSPHIYYFLLRVRPAKNAKQNGLFRTTGENPCRRISFSSIFKLWFDMNINIWYWIKYAVNKGLRSPGIGGNFARLIAPVSNPLIFLSQPRVSNHLQQPRLG